MQASDVTGSRSARMRSARVLPAQDPLRRVVCERGQQAGMPTPLHLIAQRKRVLLLFRRGVADLQRA